MTLLPNERACLLALQRIGSPATWEAITTEARMPHMKQKEFVRCGLIKKLDRNSRGRAALYSLTAKGLEECK